MLKNQLLECPEIPPLSKPEKLMVMLHGLGSDGNDLINLVPYLQQSMSNCHFISPHGIEPYDMAPFGRQWFSLKDRDAKTVLKLLATNAHSVKNLIEQQQKALSLTNKDTILLGFSQGAMVAL